MTELLGDTMNPGEIKLPPKFLQATVGRLFGDIWQGDELAIEERSLITCCLLVAPGRENERRIHFKCAKNMGIRRAKIEAAITHIAHYAEWPIALWRLRF